MLTIPSSLGTIVKLTPGPEKSPPDHAVNGNGKAANETFKAEVKIDDVPKLPDGVTLKDFSAFMPMHSYIYHPTRETVARRQRKRAHRTGSGCR